MRFLLLLISFYAFSVFSNDVLFIGIAGGTGSGKTTISSKLFSAFKDEAIILSQDDYYKSLSYLPMEERAKCNFDHPDSIDFNLLYEHLLDLKNNKNIEVPIYDFCTHSRKDEKVSVYPQKIVIVEGILVFVDPKIRDLFDIKIYVDTDDDIRLMRRIERDLTERGRTFENIKKQYLETVYHMHHQFVAPSKRYADVIVPGGINNSIAINMIISKLCAHLNE